MDQETIREALQKIVADSTGMLPVDVRDDMRFADDFGMEAQDVINLILETELRFDIDIPMNVINGNSTFGYYVLAVAKVMEVK